MPLDRLDGLHGPPLRPGHDLVQAGTPAHHEDGRVGAVPGRVDRDERLGLVRRVLERARLPPIGRLVEPRPAEQTLVPRVRELPLDARPVDARAPAILGRDPLDERAGDAAGDDLLALGDVRMLLGRDLDRTPVVGAGDG